MRTILYSLTLIAIISATACSHKEKSRDWIEGEITVLNSLDGAPVKRYVQLRIFESSILGSQTTTKDLGITDANGKLKLDVQVPRRASYYVGTHVYYNSDPQDYIPVNNKKKNELVIYVPPVYYYKMDIINANCSGDQDSMWFNHNTTAYTGCFSSIYPNSSAPMSGSANMSFHVRVKRNGVVTEYDEHFALVPEEVTKIVLEY